MSEERELLPITRVLDYYDGPQVFTVEHFGQRFIGVACSDDDGFDCAIIGVSEESLEQFLWREADLFEILRSPHPQPHILHGEVRWAHGWFDTHGVRVEWQDGPVPRGVLPMRGYKLSASLAPVPDSGMPND